MTDVTSIYAVEQEEDECRQRAQHAAEDVTSIYAVEQEENECRQHAEHAAEDSHRVAQFRRPHVALLGRPVCRAYNTDLSLTFTFSHKGKTCS